MPRVSAAYLEGRRRQILDAALRCFAREGFHRTSMQDIVDEAASSPGAIYRYFRSKEDIITAIASQRHAVERQMLGGAAAGPASPQGLRELARRFLGRLSDPGEQEWRRITVQLWAEALRSERVMAAVREGRDEPLALLSAWIRRGQEAGAVPGDLDPLAAARVAVAIFHGLVLQQAWDPDVDVAAYVRAVESLLDGWLGAQGRGEPRAER